MGMKGKLKLLGSWSLHELSLFEHTINHTHFNTFINRFFTPAVVWL